MYLEPLRAFYRAMTSPVVLSKEAWNRLVQSVEKLYAAVRANQLTVQAPLYLIEGPSGSLLSLKEARENRGALVKEAVSGSSGFYRGRLLDCPDPQAGAIDATDFYTTAPSTTPNCIIANAAEVAGGGPLKTGSTIVVVGFLKGFNNIANGGVGTSDDDGLPILEVWAFVGSFPVDLVNDGGADGTASSSTAATWTYTVHPRGDSSTTLGTAVSVLAPRLFACQTTKATKGLASYNSSGNVVIEIAYESYGYTPCT